MLSLSLDGIKVLFCRWIIHPVVVINTAVTEFKPSKDFSAQVFFLNRKRRFIWSIK
ncbi:hypothetical protein BDA99DRAFT_505826 [Phascolomyces articulosus]|uniref:Uncharacterized protein n=1 Tax=Phascolomyces articulosus TaxID=60185 RepID=A0AAD5K2F3_9FUNG|nr:hypothetical protein BDA99DRAFT_505826 [Phascolomyces articulosus]